MCTVSTMVTDMSSPVSVGLRDCNPTHVDLFPGSQGRWERGPETESDPPP